MASDEFSTYEAKARFSELLRMVREGRTVTITYHGEPVAEVRPIRPATGLRERVESLRGRGAVQGGGGVRGKLGPQGTRPGALDRFLAERDG